MIGAWMLYCVAVAALFALLAFAAERGLRLYGRPGRWAWAAALIGSLALPLWSWLVPASSSADAATAGGVGLGAPLVLAADAAGSAVADSLPGWSLPALEPYLVALWISASALLCGYLVFCAWRLRRRRSGWSEATIGGARVLVSERTGPAALGFVRGRVVLPRWALAFGDRRKELLVAHEREHLRAGDPRLLAAALGALVLMPWNLALWWQLRRLRLAVELDCDARVLGARSDVRGYGELLLGVGRRASRGGRAPVVAFSHPTSLLERRVRAMTNHTPKHRSLKTVALGALAAFALALACEAPAPERVTSPEEAPANSVAPTDDRPDQVRLTLVGPDSVRIRAVKEGGRIRIKRNSPAPTLEVKDVTLAGSPPLIFVDGERIEPLKSLNALAIEPENIKSIEVIKGPVAAQKYGPEAKNGVIRITTKDADDG